MLDTNIDRFKIIVKNQLEKLPKTTGGCRFAIAYHKTLRKKNLLQ